MAKLLKLRRGTTTQHGSFTGAEGEVTVDTTKDTLVVHDGSTAGGHAVAAEDMENVSSAAIMGQVSTGGIAHTKIANGTLPSGIKVSDGNIDGNLTIESADIVNGTIVADDLASNAVTAAKINNGVITDAKINASAAIAGTKISPDFGSQNITTTGTITTTDDIIINGSTGDESVLRFYDGGAGSWMIRQSNNDNVLSFRKDATNHLQLQANGNVDVANGLDVTGNITVTGTVDGVDVAALNTTVGTFTSGTGALNNGVTATTQAAGDATTKLATTAFVGTAVSNLVDSSPAALNTLNELAAAIGCLLYTSPSPRDRG